VAWDGAGNVGAESARRNGVHARRSRRRGQVRRPRRKIKQAGTFGPEFQGRSSWPSAINKRGCGVSRVPWSDSSASRMGRGPSGAETGKIRTGPKGSPAGRFGQGPPIQAMAWRSKWKRGPPRETGRAPHGGPYELEGGPIVRDDGRSSVTVRPRSGARFLRSLHRGSDLFRCTPAS